MTNPPRLEVLRTLADGSLRVRCTPNSAAPAFEFWAPTRGNLNGFTDWCDGPDALIAAGLARRVFHRGLYSHIDYVATPALAIALQVAR